jgi:hypothetical protein
MNQLIRELLKTIKLVNSLYDVFYDELENNADSPLPTRDELTIIFNDILSELNETLLSLPTEKMSESND